MNNSLKQYLQLTVKYELKWMYHYDVDDHAFGVETDKYAWCKRVLDGDVSIHGLLEYFSKYYPNDEKHFIDKIKNLIH